MTHSVLIVFPLIFFFFFCLEPARKILHERREIELRNTVLKYCCLILIGSLLSYGDQSNQPSLPRPSPPPHNRPRRPAASHPLPPPPDSWDSPGPGWLLTLTCHVLGPTTEGGASRPREGRGQHFRADKGRRHVKVGRNRPRWLPGCNFRRVRSGLLGAD